MVDADEGVTETVQALVDVTLTVALNVALFPAQAVVAQHSAARAAVIWHNLPALIVLLLFIRSVLIEIMQDVAPDGATIPETGIHECKASPRKPTR